MPDIDTKVEPSPIAPLIVALCERTVKWVPDWVRPNQVTVFSLGATVSSGLFLYLGGLNTWWFVPAVAMDFLHIYVDTLDGVLARARGLSSERGFFLDIALDAIGYAAVFLGVAFAHYTLFVPFACYLIIILLNEIVLLLEMLLLRAFVIPFPGPDEIPFIMALLCALTAFAPSPVFHIGPYPIGWFDSAALVLGTATLIDFIAHLVRVAKRLPGPGAVLGVA